MLSGRQKADDKSTDIADKNRPKSRKYDESYIYFGFTSVFVTGIEQPQCVICQKMLSAESMKPSKLKQHLETSHAHLTNKPRDFFIRKRDEMKQQNVSLVKYISALQTSYQVGYKIAQCKKPHTIGENLILPSPIDMVTTTLGEFSAKQLLSIPLSNDTVCCRIADMAEDLKEQLNEKIRSKSFAIQIDEATDNAKDAHLITYFRFFDDGKINKEITGTRSFRYTVIDSFMKSNLLQWLNCVGICTDGACSRPGCDRGLQVLICQKSRGVVWTHCMIHRQALASKYLSSALVTINVVNYIKTRPEKARMFARFRGEMGVEHTSLLFYCESRWLSHGNVLTRVFELRNERHQYLIEERCSSVHMFIDCDFNMQLAYLSDIFNKLNTLNTAMQGVYDKLKAFIRKVELWQSKMENSNLDMFPTLKQFIESNNTHISEDVKFCILNHHSSLKFHFKNYFSDMDTEKFDWIRNPLDTKLIAGTLTTNKEEQIIDISCDTALKNVSEFWIGVQNEYKELSEKAMNILILFATSYLCESGFSAVAAIKSKYRSKVNVEREMRVAISTMKPRFQKLCNNKQ
uniref:HAT C-terminal dimerisation domain-containing protein n=1 Tax=Pelodiscus sinensis TaxID=13735 RepID=K7FSU2_PELSI